MLFDKTLEMGLIGEGEIAKWVNSRGNSVLPAYEIENQFKGPRLFCPDRALVTPDMLVIGKKGAFCWIEAKTKSVWSWHLRTSNFQDGIDAHHWDEYQEVQSRFSMDVWILFLHRESKGCSRTPKLVMPPSPGLYGATVDEMENTVDHRSSVWGSTGMVYWNLDKPIHKLADYPLIAGSAQELTKRRTR